jgi:hypothetical protein
LGLAALGLIALAPIESKADDGFRVYVDPDYTNTGTIIMATTDSATTAIRMNIDGGGTGTIIDSITIRDL